MTLGNLVKYLIIIVFFIIALGGIVYLLVKERGMG
jgi:hypothetical protein